MDLNEFKKEVEKIGKEINNVFEILKNDNFCNHNDYDIDLYYGMDELKTKYEHYVKVVDEILEFQESK